MAKSPLTRDMGCLQTLRSLLHPSSSVEPVFVSIDFERPQYVINQFQSGLQNTQVGLAILDIRDLRSTSNFRNFNFITGEDAYFEESAPASHWAIAEKISAQEMLPKINKCLGKYQNRSIVLVGHGMSGDLAALKALRFGFERSLVIAKLDTYLLARDLQIGHLSLRNLLMELDCPCNFKLHNAANDADYTLRVILLLGIKALGAPESKETSERVEILWWIAKGGIILPRQKKYLRRKAAKTRSLEEQEELRAQRQQRRELYEQTLSDLVIDNILDLL